MSNLQQRDKVILAKYMQAEDVRETSKIIKNTIEIMKYQPKMQLYNISKYQSELEDSLMQAWKDRQDKLNHLSRKHKLESIDNITVLHKKIRKESKNQESKFIRRDKPTKPKLEPLPYMKKIRENLTKSMDIMETPDNQRDPTPEENFVTKRVQFELVNSSRKSPFHRQDTKKFYTEIKSRV